MAASLSKKGSPTFRQCLDGPFCFHPVLCQVFGLDAAVEPVPLTFYLPGQ